MSTGAACRFGSSSGSSPSNPDRTGAASLTPDISRLSTQRATWYALAIGLVSVAIAVTLWQVQDTLGDVDQLVHASRAMWNGRNPYDIIGPDREIYWPWLLYYPLTGAIILSPLAWLPVDTARAMFVFLSVSLLAFAVLRDGGTRLPLFGSAAFFLSLFAAQWSMLTTAALMLPALSFVFIAKPNLAVTYLVMSPTRRGIFALLGAGLVAGLLSLLLVPWWPLDWVAAVRSDRLTFSAPVMHRGGVVLMLALLRWRRPEARLLLAMSVSPHNMVLYEALPLFLVPNTFRQNALLALLSTLAVICNEVVYRNQRDWLIIFLYIPCLIMVLRRPNQERGSSTFGARAR